MMKKATLGALLVLFILGTSTAWAQEGSTEGTKGTSKFWVVPALGYRTSADFGIVSEDVDYSRIRFDSGFAYGLSFGYRLSEYLSVEAMWSHAGTTVQGVYSGDEPLPPNETLFGAAEDQIHANLILSAGYSIGAAKPYFLLGLGATLVNPEGDIASVSRFSWSLGTGFDYMFSKSLGFRAQAKFSPTYINTTEDILFEWTGGYQATPSRNNMTQWEFMGGLIFRF